MCREDEAYLAGQAEAALQSLSTDKPGDLRSVDDAGCGTTLSIDKLLGLSRPIRSRVLRLVLQGVKQDLRRIDASHYEAIERLLLYGQSGDSLNLPRNICVERVFEDLRIYPRAGGQEEQKNYSLALPVPGCATLPFHGKVWQSRLLDRSMWAEEAQNLGPMLKKKASRPAWTLQAYLDCSKISELTAGQPWNPLTIRNARTGDRYPQGRSHRLVRVVDLLSRRRLAKASERRAWPLLVMEDEILWVRGCRPSSKVAATLESTQVLAIEELTAAGARMQGSSRENDVLLVR